MSFPIYRLEEMLSKVFSSRVQISDTSHIQRSRKYLLTKQKERIRIMPAQFRVTGIWKNDEYISDLDKVFNELVG